MIKKVYQSEIKKKITKDDDKGKTIKKNLWEWFCKSPGEENLLVPI
jgi:hypothetical protein